MRRPVGVGHGRGRWSAIRLPSTRVLRRLCAVLFAALVLIWLAAAGIWLARGPYPIPGLGDSISLHATDRLSVVYENRLREALDSSGPRPSAGRGARGRADSSRNGIRGTPRRNLEEPVPVAGNPGRLDHGIPGIHEASGAVFGSRPPVQRWQDAATVLAGGGFRAGFRAG